jgi:hypothetical protein
VAECHDYAEIVGLNRHRMHACTVQEVPLEWTRLFHIGGDGEGVIQHSVRRCFTGGGTGGIVPRGSPTWSSKTQ